MAWSRILWVLTCLFAISQQDVPLFKFLGQSAYDLVEERVEVEYVNPTLAECTSYNYRYNKTSRTHNITVMLKYDVTDGDMFMLKGFKLLSNRYRLDILQYNTTVKNLLSIPQFDLKRLFQNCTTPPVMWPIRKGVRYVVKDCLADGTTFPPGIPEGRWKFEQQFATANNTIVLTLNSYMAIKYKVKMED